MIQQILEKNRYFDWYIAQLNQTPRILIALIPGAS
jgi:hypothetical protein